MKLEINAELIATEVVNEHFIPSLKSAGVPDASPEKVKVLVQNKAGEWVEVSSEKVKLVWKN